MIKRLMTKEIGLIAASLCFALILFLTANAAYYKTAGTTNKKAVETYTHTLENVPVEIKYDEDKYFITGYVTETDVYLTSTNRVKLDTEINPDTRHFKLIVDLSNAGVGTAKLPIEIRNLPSEMTASVSPANVSVTIGKKKTKVFDISHNLTGITFSKDYQAESVKLSETMVNVTSDEATIELIDYIGFNLPENQVISSDYEGEVTLQAYSKEGKVLPSVIKPSVAKLTLKVKKLSKTIPVNIELVGEMSEKISDISYELEQSTIVVEGTKGALSKINELILKIDISDIDKDMTKNFKLELPEVKVIPESIKVKLTVTKEKKE